MATLFYTGLVHRNGETGYGIQFPDLPGCVSVGDSLDETARQARAALALHLAGMMEDQLPLPEPTPMDRVASDPEFPEIGRMLVEATLPGKSIRVNLTIEEGLLAAIDRAATERGTSRSGFMAEAARHILAGQAATARTR